MAETRDADLLMAAAIYLRALNIEPVVVGGVSVQHQPAERQHNHELVIRFTAVLPTAADHG